MLQLGHHHRAFSRAGLTGIWGTNACMSLLCLIWTVERVPVEDRLADRQLPGACLAMGAVDTLCTLRG